MRRITSVLSVMVVMAAMVAVSGAALAQEPRGGADVCVSQGGQTIYDMGASSCFSNPTSQAVAINHSDFAAAQNNSQAVAINRSVAIARNVCSVAALNGQNETCP